MIDLLFWLTGVTLDACGVFGGIKVGNFRHPDNSNWFFTCYNDTKRQPECQQCAAPSLHFIEKCNMCLGEIDGVLWKYFICQTPYTL